MSFKKSRRKKNIIKRSYKLYLKRLKRKKVWLQHLRATQKALIKKLEFVTSRPPENFSFINNADSYLEYLQSIHKVFKKWKSINLDLLNLTDLTFDALCLLKAELRDKNFIEWCHFKGNEPRDQTLKELFRKSWFYLGLHHNQKNLSFSWAMINHRKNIKVVEKIAKIVTDDICHHAFDSIHPKKWKIYPNIIECMANTHDHAEWNCNWWLFYYKEEWTWITKVCFLDLWIWIFQSLWSRLNWTWQNLWEIAWMSSNASILEKILKGEMKVPISSTWKKERWKWLLSLYAFSKEKYVKNLRIISNNVYWHLSNDIYYNLKNNFDWTFIYWEIIPNHD